MRKSIAAAISLLFVVPGCGNTNYYFGTPNILHPGSLAYQRWRAEIFDPYPTPYLGTPVEGARPPQFGTPEPEPEAQNKDLRTRFGPPPSEYDIRPIL